MPIVFWYIFIMLAVIFLWFLAFKRPIYEGILLSFVILLFVTGTWSNVFVYIDKALGTSLLYSMMAFCAMSQILAKTKVIDNCVMIIIALLGRIPGGAGYASILASSFMGALSGSGPGNDMATGAITIPAMIKSGFPPELAANVESTSSYLGNMIPPLFKHRCGARCSQCVLSRCRWWERHRGLNRYILDRVLGRFSLVHSFEIYPTLHIL